MNLMNIRPCSHPKMISKYVYLSKLYGLPLCKAYITLLLVNRAIAQLIITVTNDISSIIKRYYPIPIDISGSCLCLYLNSLIIDFIVIMLHA